MKILAASTLLLLACGPSLRDAQLQNETNDRLLRQRARFDLSCDALSTTPLAHDYDINGHEYVTVAGVTGCGRKATYAIAHGKWLMNSETQSAGSAEPGKTAPASTR